MTCVHCHPTSGTAREAEIDPWSDRRSRALDRQQRDRSCAADRAACAPRRSSPCRRRRAADQHLPAQAGGEEPVRPPRRGRPRTTTDPAPWGKNWPREYDGYKRTADVDAAPRLRRLGGAARARRSSATRGSSACSPATRSRSTTATAAATPTCSRPGADQARDRSGRSPAPACTATPRSSRPTGGSATAT